MSRLLPGLLESVYCRTMRGFRAARRHLAPVMRCEVGGIPIRLGLASESEHYRAETYASKEPETIAWLTEELREGDVFFDVGANIGLYSLYAAKLRPSCRVYAFEPESHNFSALCRNALLNGAANLTPCCFPLSNVEGFQWFHVYDLEPGSSLHSLGRPGSFQRDPAVLREGTLSTTLDALIERHGLPAPTLLKIDVDGIEETILEGGVGLLKTETVRSILVEVTRGPSTTGSWAEEKLAPLGFALARKSEWTLELEGLTSQNYIFRRESRGLVPDRIGGMPCEEVKR